jgi:hypothetical protein
MYTNGVRFKLGNILIKFTEVLLLIPSNKMCKIFHIGPEHSYYILNTNTFSENLLPTTARQLKKVVNFTVHMIADQFRVTKKNWQISHCPLHTSKLL